MMALDNSLARFPTTRIMAEECPAEPRMTLRGAVDYPARLVGAGNPPRALWIAGRLPGATEKALAIVGSRAATASGCERARLFARELGRRGWAIVSGGAFGIDAAAHEGALDAGAPTFAVLGCGLDVVYPDRHAALFGRIAESGGLITEHPPGTQPRAAHFPTRNRIIAGLSDWVLVVEAAARSGALITARFARRNGQRVMAVPGSAGTDWLIAGGADAVTTSAEMEEVLAGRAVHPSPSPLPSRGEPLGKLLGALRERADTPAGLAHRLGLPLSVVMGALGEAELDGWIRRTPGSRYEVARA